MNRCTTIAASLLLAACSSGERPGPSPFTSAAPPVDISTGSTSTGSTTAEDSTTTDTASTSSGGSASTTGAVDMGASSTGDAGFTSGTTAIDSSTSTSGWTPDSSSSSTTTGAPLPSCGDGFVDAGEECDEGPGNADDSLCTLACAFAVCGDGLVFPDEEVCDDGNALNTDACLDTCGAALCGDGFVFVGVETCDDANLINDDACSDACAKAACDDGAKNGEETALDCGGPTCKACSIPGLVINEVDYDDVVADDPSEFIELVNTTASPINLAGHSIMLVNGMPNPIEVYLTVDLAPAGVIGAGQYLVIATPAVNVHPAALKISLAKGNTVQNGKSNGDGKPDGIALIDTSKGVVLDALSYEGSVPPFTLPGVNGPVDLVEGSPCAFTDQGAGSLARAPDGYDANNAATDWGFSPTPTPGAPNM